MPNGVDIQLTGYLSVSRADVTYVAKLTPVLANDVSLQTGLHQTAMISARCRNLPLSKSRRRLRAVPFYGKLRPREQLYLLKMSFQPTLFWCKKDIAMSIACLDSWWQRLCLVSNLIVSINMAHSLYWLSLQPMHLELFTVHTGAKARKHTRWHQWCCSGEKKVLCSSVCSAFNQHSPSSPCYLHSLPLFSKDASFSDIRKAYRRLSLVLHPDKNKDENAETQFRQVSHAVWNPLDVAALLYS